MNKEEYSTKIEFLREVFPNLAEDVIVARLQRYFTYSDEITFQIIILFV